MSSSVLFDWECPFTYSEKNLIDKASPDHNYDKRHSFINN